MVGLGNPSSRYEQNRHNVGFLVVDRIASRVGVRLKKPRGKRYILGCGWHEGERICLAKPLTFMNASGEVLGGLLETTNLALHEMLVVCDNLDLAPGQCRLRLRGSSAGHRGLKSIIAHAGTDGFKRVFVGIGRPENQKDVVDYVLSNAGDEVDLIDAGIVRAAEGVLMLLHRDPGSVMNVLNSRTTTV